MGVGVQADLIAYDQLREYEVEKYQSKLAVLAGGGKVGF